MLIGKSHYLFANYLPHIVQKQVALKYLNGVFFKYFNYLTFAYDGLKLESR